MDANHKAQSRLVFFAICIGAAYFLFCTYYAARRLEKNEWNKRQSQFSSNLWLKDEELKKIHARMMQKMNSMEPEITIVTAYFNIGKLNKGGPFGQYTPQKYIEWMSVFGRIDNPLIVFTDSHQVKDIFEKLREKFPPERTQVLVIKREELWAFQLAEEIKGVFSQPNYPTHDPNTVHENYSCVMHAKFELVNKVIREEMFRTKYLAWLDIGLFRAVVEETHIFPLSVPKDFDPTKVAYSGQSSFDPSLTPMQVVAGNKVWVGGAMFLGRPEILYLYTQDYMRAVRKLLDMRVMSTDQQVIYIMYLPSFDLQPRVELQTYTTHGEDDWFYLGYLLKDAWDISLRSTQPVARFLLSLMS
ncbi:hypothetical protein ACOMHN_022481 [Nucella lapillus]